MYGNVATHPPTANAHTGLNTNTHTLSLLDTGNKAKRQFDQDST